MTIFLLKIKIFSRGQNKRAVAARTSNGSNIFYWIKKYRAAGKTKRAAAAGGRGKARTTRRRREANEPRTRATTTNSAAKIIGRANYFDSRQKTSRASKCRQNGRTSQLFARANERASQRNAGQVKTYLGARRHSDDDAEGRAAAAAETTAAGAAAGAAGGAAAAKAADDSERRRQQ